MSNPASKAIFLSYARDDATAARRIAEALRSKGLEVWFDENELRGGDAWDAKIRRQIDACALFIPIISQRTELRAKGYFRLEWNLAVDQTKMLAQGVPFIAPVVVDDTGEKGASVPAEFLRVQWMRLPEALPTPAFVSQIERLLEAPPKSPAARRSDAGASMPSTARAAGARRRFPRRIVFALGAVALAVLAFTVLRPATKEAPAASTPAKPVPETEAAPTAPPVNEKSLAVLPFENLSPDKENEFFTSGIHEEILAALQTVRELHVIEYRGANKTMRQIGEELGVAYALECSVRREGTKVRVTGKLTDTRTGTQAWADNFEGDLSDVFAIQSEIAKAIAAKLSAALSPVEKTTIERRSTTSVSAYDLYLKALDIRIRSPNTESATAKTEALLLSAVQLDPQFAQAWGELAFTHEYRYSDDQDRSESRLELARAALETMKRLAPDDPVTLRQEGNFYYFTTRDYTRALEFFTQSLALRPNDPESYYSLCQVQRRQGKWAECMDNFRKAIVLDPQNDRLLRNAADTLEYCRHYEEALDLQKRRAELDPTSDEAKRRIAVILFKWRGSTAEGDLLAKNASPIVQAVWADEKGDFKELVRLLPQIPANRRWLALDALFGVGYEMAARQRAEGLEAQAKADTVEQPTNDQAWIWLAEIQSALGQHEEALASGQKAIGLTPESTDTWSGPEIAADVAALYARAGQTDRALSEFARVLGNGGANVYELRAAPLPAAFKSDPRFQALLNNSKNNAPLF